MRDKILLCALSAAGALMALSDDDDKREGPPVEFGRVAWERKLETGLEAASRTEKPVLLLFQEVPG